MGFLGKARKMMGGSAPPEPPKPQYYQVACAEGHVIRGERTQGYQALRCPHCGDGVFVLPRSPLPLPPTPSSSRSKARTSRRSEPEAVDDAGIELTDAPLQDDLEEIQWIDPDAIEAEEIEPSEPEFEAEIDFSPDPKPEPAPDPEPDPRPKSRPKPPQRTADSPTAPTRVPRPARPVSVSGNEDDPGTEPGQISVPIRPRKGGRVLLVVAAVALLAGATIYYRAWRNRLQELPHVAEVNAAEGKVALESGRFDDAKAKLKRAADAYRELKSSDETAAEAIRLADEAAILADLGLTPLSEILDEVARLGEADGMEKFKIRHKGQSILIDTEIEAVEPKVELSYRVFVGRGPVPAKVGRLDVADFELLQGRDFKPSEGVIFGARLDSIRIEGKEWRIILQPRSGVWMTNPKALAIGFGEAPPS